MQDDDKKELGWKCHDYEPCRHTSTRIPTAMRIMTPCAFSREELAAFWSYSINGSPEDKRLGIVTLLLLLLKEMDPHGLCHHQCAWHWYWIRDTYTIPITDPIWRYPQFASLDHTNSTTCKSFKHIMPRKASCCKVAYIQRLFWMRLMLSRWCEKVLMSLCMSNL